MGQDMCVACGDGVLNIRVGAIIEKDGKILMVGSDRVDFLYSVGGRIKLGETAEEAVVREVFEETGVRLEVDRLGFVQQNYFRGFTPKDKGKLFYELAFFFYMKVPEGFTPVGECYSEGENKERLQWISLDDDVKIFPKFFKTELKNPTDAVKYILTDDR